MDLLKELASVLAAGVMVVSGALKEAAPQHDADGLLFLVNRQYMISDAFEPADLREAQVPGRCARCGTKRQPLWRRCMPRAWKKRENS